MNTVIDYVVATGTDVKSLAKDVKTWLEDGYQPFGSLSTTLAGNNGLIYLYQPMVKTEKPN
jgi:hypothetical protein